MLLFVCFLSLSLIVLRFIDVAASIDHSFLFMADSIPLCGYHTHYVFKQTQNCQDFKEDSIVLKYRNDHFSLVQKRYCAFCSPFFKIDSA